MKNFLLKAKSHLLKFGLAYFWVLWGVVSILLLVRTINKEDAQRVREINIARQETAELRGKIQNHLIAEHFYDKPAKEVLPVLKDFGIGL